MTKPLRKPMDPRKHGLKMPVKTYTKEEKISLQRLNENGFYSYNEVYSLKQVNDLWENILHSLSHTEKQIVSGPFFDNGNLAYTLEWMNESYAEEKKAYDVTVSNYQAALEQYNKDMEIINYKEEIIDKDKIDHKIALLEGRIATLKSVRDGTFVRPDSPWSE